MALVTSNQGTRKTISKKANLDSFFRSNLKKVKTHHLSNNNDIATFKTDSQTTFEHKDLFLPLMKADSECETSNEISEENLFKWIQPLNYKRLSGEGLNVNYFRLFLKSTADEIFDRLEKEVEYFSGNLLKVQIFGKWHKIPRKQVSYGDPGLSYKFSGNCIPAIAWTPIMLQLKRTVESVLNEQFNFVLVNRYKDGQDYMGEHRDDEKDLVADAAIASLSFGQPRDFIFRHKDSRGAKATRKIDPVKVNLEHGSLLVMKPPTNTFWYHSLPVRKKLMNARVNLTFRKMVPKN